LLALRNQNPISFGPFSSSQENKVPQKWSIFGDQSLDTLLSNDSIWFPSDIDEAVALRDIELYLFDGSLIRYAMITNDWPQGMQPFDCDLFSLLRKCSTFFAVTLFITII
jgi:hypothetical protein